MEEKNTVDGVIIGIKNNTSVKKELHATLLILKYGVVKEKDRYRRLDTDEKTTDLYCVLNIKNDPKFEENINKLGKHYKFLFRFFSKYNSKILNEEEYLIETFEKYGVNGKQAVGSCSLPNLRQILSQK
jgi:hypothetical protein